jgi:phosphate starvation-inducible protein PhoH and related proteins
MFSFSNPHFVPVKKYDSFSPLMMGKKKVSSFSEYRFDGDAGAGAGDAGAAGSSYSPKTQNQRTYTQSIRNPTIPLVVAIGPAGSGKTMLACTEAISMLKAGYIKRIVLTRPLITVEEEEIGFLPGNMNLKMDPWTRPMFDIFREVYGTNELNGMLNTGIIEIAPLAFMRGRTFHDTFVLADEMQNSSPGQMLMLTTRLGRNTKMVITGDLRQSDRTVYASTSASSCTPTIKKNGLDDLVQKIQGIGTNTYTDTYTDTYPESSPTTHPLISLVQMDHYDILRSPFVSYILQLYSNQPN